MMKRLREWGFPIGLLTLWILVAAYTLHALTATRSTLQAAPESTEMPTMVGRPVAIEAQNPAHHHRS
jgi:hypothetical protein